MSCLTNRININFPYRFLVSFCFKKYISTCLSNTFFPRASQGYSVLKFIFSFKSDREISSGPVPGFFFVNEDRGEVQTSAGEIIAAQLMKANFFCGHETSSEVWPLTSGG